MSHRRYPSRPSPAPRASESSWGLRLESGHSWSMEVRSRCIPLAIVVVVVNCNQRRGGLSRRAELELPSHSHGERSPYLLILNDDDDHRRTSRTMFGGGATNPYDEIVGEWPIRVSADMSLKLTSQGDGREPDQRELGDYPQSMRQGSRRRLRRVCNCQ